MSSGSTFGFGLRTQYSHPKFQNLDCTLYPIVNTTSTSYEVLLDTMVTTEQSGRKTTQVTMDNNGVEQESNGIKTVFSVQESMKSPGNSVQTEGMTSPLEPGAKGAKKLPTTHVETVPRSTGNDVDSVSPSPAHLQHNNNNNNNKQFNNTLLLPLRPHQLM
jgi:hypothetical protein